MITEIQNFRQKYPQYNDMSDGELAQKLASKYPDAYGDLPGKVKTSQGSGMFGKAVKAVEGFFTPEHVATAPQLDRAAMRGNVGKPILNSDIISPTDYQQAAMRGEGKYLGNPRQVQKNISAGVQEMKPILKQESIKAAKAMTLDPVVGAVKELADTGAGAFDTAANLLGIGTQAQRDYARNATREAFAPDTEGEAIGRTVGSIGKYALGGYLAGASEAPGILGAVSNLVRNVASGSAITAAQYGGDLMRGDKGARNNIVTDAAMDVAAAAIPSVASPLLKFIKNDSDNIAAQVIHSKVSEIANDPDNFVKRAIDLQSKIDTINNTPSVSPEFKAGLQQLSLPAATERKMITARNDIAMPEDVSAINQAFRDNIPSTQALPEGTGEPIKGAISMPGDVRNDVVAEKITPEWTQLTHKTPDNTAALDEPMGNPSKQDIRAAFDSITPKAIRGDEVYKDGMDIKEARQRALNLLTRKLPSTVQNDSTNWLINLNKRSIKNSLAHYSGPDKINSLYAIDGLLKDAVLVDTLPKNENGLLTHIFANKINIGDKNYTVSLGVREDRNGKRFYDHQLFDIKELDPIFSKANGRVAEQEASNQALTLNNIVRNGLNIKGNDSGFTTMDMSRSLAGAGAGGVIGASTGNTAEDKIKNGLIGAAGGLAAVNTGSILRRMDALGRVATDRIKGTKFDNAMRYVTDPFHSLTRASKDQLVDNVYSDLRPTLAQGDISAREFGDSLNKFIAKSDNDNEKMSKFIVRYLENPDFRKQVKGADSELSGQLDTIATAIDNGSEELFQRGLLTPSQRYKWQGKYLTRLYNKDNAIDGMTFAKGGRQYEIQKGRKIDSIMDLPDEDRKLLGYITDPVKSVKATVAKTNQIVAYDDFYRDISGIDGVVDPVSKQFMVNLPDELKVGQLPETMSPYYAKEKIRPYLAQMVAAGDLDKKAFAQWSAEVSKKAAQMDAYKTSDNFIGLGDKQKVRYGVLSGMPIDKTVASYLESMAKFKEKPIMFAGKLDATISALMANFKAMKVPLNPQAYPRNYITNALQWTLSGGNPAAYVPETVRAAKSLIKKDSFYHRMEAAGLFHTNYASQEVQDILKSINVKDKSFLQKYFDKVSQLSAGYGMVDDTVKMARVRYELNKGKSLGQAVRIAQDAHMDYSMVSDFVRQARSGQSFAGKIALTPFLSFAYKTGGLLYENILQRPATSIAVLASAPALKYGFEAYQRQKNGKDYASAERLTPEYMDTPSTVMWMDNHHNAYYLPMDYIIPWSQLVSSNPVSGAMDMYGFGQSPYGLAQEIITNKQTFTGQPIYGDFDTNTMKTVKSAGYAAKTLFSPAAVDQAIRFATSKHPALPKLAGLNVYRYSIPELAMMKQGEESKLRGEIYTDMAHAYRNGKSLETVKQKYDDAEYRLTHRTKF